MSLFYFAKDIIPYPSPLTFPVNLLSEPIIYRMLLMVQIMGIEKWLSLMK